MEMRKSILALLLTVASATAAGEWAKVGESDTNTVYADTATIDKAGNIAKMWHLLDFKSVQSRPYGLPYLSQRTQQEYDCAAMRERTIEYVHYSENMGKGDVTHADSGPGDWKAVSPGTASAARLGLACGKR
jgi:hypothetical protein